MQTSPLGPSDDQRRQTMATRHAIEQQRALRDDVDWAHQLQFDLAYAQITGEQPTYNERWRELMTGPAGRYNFTADDGSFT